MLCNHPPRGCKRCKKIAPCSYLDMSPIYTGDLTTLGINTDPGGFW